MLKDDDADLWTTRDHPQAYADKTLTTRGHESVAPRDSDRATAIVGAKGIAWFD
ncbi:hypothetical protein [Frondihabitans sp. PAMC 28766]|uniref:hypothetical protein n=1 Tax=Frondihabitans sp. PAMC 28766 TaxID=1795630 RepID=UPI0012FF5FC5|nr:hypothetical protein [Frondihabitans sp. PAMC 28766]